MEPVTAEIITETKNKRITARGAQLRALYNRIGSENI